MRGATHDRCVYMAEVVISIHAPHAGRDQNTLHFQTYKKHFNPRAPCGARPSKEQQRKRRVCISIHAPHAGRDRVQVLRVNVSNISIHAPHAGRDSRGMDLKSRLEYFNPRAPCGARRKRCRPTSEIQKFQSTRPMRGATCCPSSRFRGGRYFNPRAPCGARRIAQEVTQVYNIKFQSTRPMRGATAPSAPRTSRSRYFNPRAPCGARR